MFSPLSAERSAPRCTWNTNLFAPHKLRGGNAAGGNALCNFARRSEDSGAWPVVAAAATGYCCFSLSATMSIMFALPVLPVISTRMRHVTSARSPQRSLLHWRFTARPMVWPWEFNRKRPQRTRQNGRYSSALCIHKVPEGLALGSLLIGAGLQRSTALCWVAAVEATTLVGGVIGMVWLGKVSTFWLGLIMAHVGGGFLYLATHAVVGEMLKHGKKLVLTSFSIGVGLIAVLNIGLRAIG